MSFNNVWLLGVNIRTSPLQRRVAAYRIGARQRSRLTRQGGGWVNLPPARGTPYSERMWLMGGIATRIDLEMGADAMLDFAEQIRPPISAWLLGREELTPKAGLDVPAKAGQQRRRWRAMAWVSLFIDAEPSAVEAASVLGPPVIGTAYRHYANAGVNRLTAWGGIRKMY